MTDTLSRTQPAAGGRPSPPRWLAAPIALAGLGLIVHGFLRTGPAPAPPPTTSAATDSGPIVSKDPLVRLSDANQQGPINSTPSTEDVSPAAEEAAKPATPEFPTPSIVRPAPSTGSTSVSPSTTYAAKTTARADAGAARPVPRSQAQSYELPIARPQQATQQAADASQTPSSPHVASNSDRAQADTAPLRSTPAPSPAPGGEAHQGLRRPIFLRVPSFHDYIPYLRKAPLPGQLYWAQVDCKATASGALESCYKISETPEGSGFGEAIVHLSSRFQIAPTDSQGGSVQGRSLKFSIQLPNPEGVAKHW